MYKINIISNYTYQGFILLIGFVVTPLYLKLLGIEQFALFAVLTMLTSMFGLLDAGLSPALLRNVARAKSVGTYEEIANLVKSVEILIIVIGISLFSLGYTQQDYLTNLLLPKLNGRIDKIDLCILSMMLIVFFRLLVFPYKSTLNGLEAQFILSFVSTLALLMRQIGGIFLIYTFSFGIAEILLFFLIVTAFEALALITIVYVKIPNLRSYRYFLYFSYDSIKRIMPYTARVAYGTIVWIIIINADKFIILKFISEYDFGYFTLLSLLTGGILAMTAPVNIALTPRLTSLHSEGDMDKLKVVYMNSMIVMTTIVFSISATIGFNAKIFIYAWTQNDDFSLWASEITILFFLATAFLSANSFQYRLQCAFGDLKLHTLSATLSLLIQIPIVYISGVEHGVYGMAIAWLCIRIIWYLILSHAVHRRLLSGFHQYWMTQAFLPMLCSVIFTSGMISYLWKLDADPSFIHVIFKIIIIILLSIISSTLLVKDLRKLIYYFFTELNLSRRIGQ